MGVAETALATALIAGPVFVVGLLFAAAETVRIVRLVRGSRA